jgi:hypothetical protein
MKIQVIKPFKWCVKGNIHPSDFIKGVYDVDSDVGEGAIGAGWALLTDNNSEAQNIELPQDIISETEGWNTESPFTEKAGSELSASQQEIASQEKIAEKPKKKYPKVGE